MLRGPLSFVPPQKCLCQSTNRLVALTPEIAIESCHLPGYSTGDPADRIRIAPEITSHSWENQ